MKKIILMLVAVFSALAVNAEEELKRMMTVVSADGTQTKYVLSDVEEIIFEDQIVLAQEIWTWDTDFRENGAVWGTMGDNGGGADWTGGIWWGSTPEGLLGQLGHSDTGTATGEEDPDAYMIFDNTLGTVTSYAADGTQIRSGSYEITDWNNGEYAVNANGFMQLGTLKTTEGSILFPFQVNTGGGYMPTEFSIVKLTSDQLQLVYSDVSAGSWSMCTWWAFMATEVTVSE